MRKWMALGFVTLFSTFMLNTWASVQSFTSVQDFRQSQLVSLPSIIGQNNTNLLLEHLEGKVGSIELSEDTNISSLTVKVSGQKVMYCTGVGSYMHQCYFNS